MTWQLSPCRGGGLSIPLREVTARAQVSKPCCSQTGRGEQDQTLQKDGLLCSICLLFWFVLSRNNGFRMTCTHQLLGWWLFGALHSWSHLDQQRGGVKASPLGIRLHPPTSTERSGRAGSRGTSLRKDLCQEAPGSSVQAARSSA